MSVAGRAQRYPQVEAGAEALIDTRIVAVPRGADAAAALRLARQRDVAVLATGDGVVLRSDLARADALGLAALPAAALTRPAPTVDIRASEVQVRRALSEGVPAVLVADRSGLRGVATASPGLRSEPAMAARLARQLPAAVLQLLARVQEFARGEGARAWLVGGVVRDVLREGVATADVDVALEGDGHRLARALASATRGRLVLHDRFLTASVEIAGVGTIDVITARSERYEAPGALPRIMPSGIRHDLERRDFVVNAMAIDLSSDDRRLHDPLGGRGDLARRRLRILHPLSFAEDPTRIFRAGRYARRLRFTLDPWSRRARSLALRLVPYEALSGIRIVAEIERILADADPWDVLADLGAAGVYRLLDRRYRFTPRTRVRLHALGLALAAARGTGLDAAPLEAALLTLLGDQPPAVATASLRRLGFSGDPYTRLARALEAREALVAGLATAPRPSARARLLRGRSDAELVWLAITGDRITRTAVDDYARTRGLATVLRGDDVITLGVPRGPAVARVLEALRDARIDDEVHDRDGEAAYVRRWVDTREEG